MVSLAVPFLHGRPSQASGEDAAHYKVEWRSPSGSHVVFVFASGGVLTGPARRPIKPVYVKQFVDLIDKCEFPK